MYGNFRSIDLTPTISLCEPPVGLLKFVNKRIKLFTTDNDAITITEWNGVFLLACLHELVEGVVTPSISVIAKKLNIEGMDTLRSAYCDADDEKFKAVLNEFIFSIDDSTIKEWFSRVDSECYISKRKQDDEKKD